MPAQKLVSLSQQIVHVAKHFEFRIVGQVFLQVTIATVHRAVAGKVNDEIIAANLTLAARTLLEKFSFVSRQEKFLFGGTKCAHREIRRSAFR